MGCHAISSNLHGAKKLLSSVVQVNGQGHILLLSLSLALGNPSDDSSGQLGSQLGAHLDPRVFCRVLSTLDTQTLDDEASLLSYHLVLLVLG